MAERQLQLGGVAGIMVASLLLFGIGYGIGYWNGMDGQPLVYAAMINSTASYNDSAPSQASLGESTLPKECYYIESGNLVCNYPRGTWYANDSTNESVNESAG